MAIKRMGSERDGVMCAWIHGTASRHVARGEPTAEARTTAVAELREVASRDGKLRTDLLSREAGLFAGLGQAGDGHEWGRQQLRWMAALCRDAAGDQLDGAVVAEWTEIGRQRANPPMPGPRLR